ncbi:MAG: glycosyltransferase family 4 protein [Candidatus Saccharimonadales bacterium]
MAKIVIDARESGTSTGRYIDKLIEHLAKLPSQHKFIILTKEPRLGFMRKIAPKFKAIECPYEEFGFDEQLDLLKQIRDLNPDLVHFGMVQQPVFYRGRVVTTMHDLTTVRFRNPSKNWLVFTVKQQVYKWVNRRVARKSAVVITPSEFVKDDVARFARINSRKITVTYEAADPITDQAQPVEGLEGQEFIMYVGRPLPHKNLERLVDAFGLLRQQYPSLKLVLVGKQDALYKALEKQTVKKGVKNIVFTGFVDDGQLRWLYENTTAYVFPSLSEGFGLPGLEAMVAGAPVVSSNASCLPEVYKDGAEYFDPISTEDMAAAIARVLGDEKLRKQLIRQGKVIAGKYSWERLAQETLTIYDQVLTDF